MKREPGNDRDREAALLAASVPTAPPAKAAEARPAGREAREPAATSEPPKSESPQKERPETPSERDPLTKDPAEQEAAKAHAPPAEKPPEALEAAARQAAALRAARRTRRGTLISALFAGGMLLASLLFVVGSRLANHTYMPGDKGPRPILTMGQPADPGAALTVVEMIAAAQDSVVSIDLYKDGAVIPGGSGSGVILSADGYIGTNAHVVHGFDLIRVELITGEGYTARLVGLDGRTDLAVLKIGALELTPAQFGDSEQLQVGDAVVAIGNAAGILPGTPSLGILSGTGRRVSLSTSAGDITFLNLLQTDAAINPGNSGGALVNVYGQVVGVTVAKLDDAGLDNIGFAIPSAFAVPVFQRLIDEETTTHNIKLGAGVLALNETTGPARGLPGKGLYITGVAGQSSLAEEGVTVGDVILTVDGQPMAIPADLETMLSEYEAGDEVALGIYLHKTGETVMITATLYEETLG